MIPRAGDPNTIMRLLHQTAQLACSRYDRALHAQLPGMTLGRCAVLIQLAQHERPNQAALAQILDIRPITLVRLLDRLEAAASSSAYLILMIAALMSWRSPLRPCRSSRVSMS